MIALINRCVKGTKKHSKLLALCYLKWYEENISINPRQYIADEIFCNDRRLATSIPRGTGFGTSETFYAGRDRIINRIFTFKCFDENDKFTISVKNGNGKLKYPVALITVDEIESAGRLHSTFNNKFYPYKRFTFYSMTPLHKNVSDNSLPKGVALSTIDGIANGYTWSIVNNNYGLVPVINLSVETIENLVGTGTMTNPYSLK